MECKHEWYIVSPGPAIEQLYGMGWDIDRVCRKCNRVEFWNDMGNPDPWIMSAYNPVSVWKAELQDRFKGRVKK